MSDVFNGDCYSCTDADGKAAKVTLRNDVSSSTKATSRDKVVKRHMKRSE